jgi:putative protease
MEEDEVGTVTHYFGKISVGIVELSAPLAVGDTIHFKGAHDDFTQTVDSMQIEHENVESAKTGDVVGMKVTQKVHPNDKVYKVVG